MVNNHLGTSLWQEARLSVCKRIVSQMLIAEIWPMCVTGVLNRDISHLLGKSADTCHLCMRIDYENQFKKSCWMNIIKKVFHIIIKRLQRRFLHLCMRLKHLSNEWWVYGLTKSNNMLFLSFYCYGNTNTSLSLMIYFLKWRMTYKIYVKKTGSTLAKWLNLSFLLAQSTFQTVLYCQSFHYKLSYNPII